MNAKVSSSNQFVYGVVREREWKRGEGRRITVDGDDVT